ncbi:10607_t:CDS:1 [Dentiscutata heterogama]|uniref:10607_t:CDS:1 n=1 Tax=Dentiscutata heterogama TaxID=1316150 RepID=A0ACA9K0P6_9GLOM|nr:10607_t:CDS:1 [Dentiscutata heterogama]
MIYYCIPCITKFVCKRKNSIEKHKKLYQQTGKILQYKLYNQEHWRCKMKMCYNYYKLHKCNNIICSYCKTNNLRSKCVLPKTQQEFEILKEKSIIYSSGQYEATSNSQLYEQAYFQFSLHQIIKLAKDMLDYRLINFSKYLNRDLQQNQNYLIKIWNHCKEKKHKSKCCCDYFKHEKICKICNQSYIEKYTIVC